MTDQENNNSISTNPFAALFSSLDDAKHFAEIQKQQQQQQQKDVTGEDSSGSQDGSDNSISESFDDNDDSVAELSRSFRSRQELCEQLNINHMIQRIFLITLDNSDPSLRGENGIPARCVYLEEMATDLDGQDWLDMHTIAQALFSRLLLAEPGNHLIHMTSTSGLNLSADRDAGEKHILRYLFSCFRRAKEEVTKVPENLLPYAVQCKDLVVSNTRTVLLTPEIYINQNIYEQLLDLLLEAVSSGKLEEMAEFLEEVILAIVSDEEVRTFGEVMVPVFDMLVRRVRELDLCQILLYSYLDIIIYFTKQPNIAKVFLDYIQPKDPSNGQMYQKTLLGVVLGISCLLKTPGVVENHGYFLNPARTTPQEIKVQESTIHQFMVQFHEKIYQILKNLLQLSPDTKHRILSWLGNCLHANGGRTKIWANQMPEVFFQMYASDGFFLNLGAALLKLCQPFCKPRSAKILSFNPTYCTLRELNEEERRNRNVHVKGLEKETCLIQASTDQEPMFAQNYNLVTENLILTQYTLHLGFHRMKNPHLRAKLAEVLEAVMPHMDQVQSPLVPIMFHRERIFCAYQHAPFLAEALIKVFVDIEFTGDPHQFEQKFNYRRPMYPILGYMWKSDTYRQSIKNLATYASENLESVNPPLFLRFVNLLMNDAIFLLDEAIQYLSKIKIQQIEKDRGEWDSLSPEARREKDANLQMFGQLARFHNIMSNETIGTLAMLTSEIKAIFILPILAERTITMLNYFLQHLAGPKMGALKVKDFSEFDFKPQQLVSDICTIYLNLGDEENFCATVPKDGRSYSPMLFAQTVRVLKKINKPGDMILAFSNLAERVKSLADRQQQEEETYADAPDDFLDPIMSTLMIDPVMLPSSRVTVDRSTIARHLLSDQTDPFNRSPLTMDQVKPNVELKEKIHQWLSMRKQNKEHPKQTL
ncbi:ubiquitin conjugation factor E4 A isoform X2 [Protopterus annectens]|uniref:ubiquitin conjugation factor E4 A isoform X2 n=1 Tax=Protopterus annectens TaxID=7888 RepID=UPI001CFA2BDB|nr:ubiquitin conjugation factor E4 A isoform X2 [Protopterus annectens]